MKRFPEHIGSNEVRPVTVAEAQGTSSGEPASVGGEESTTRPASAKVVAGPTPAS